MNQTTNKNTLNKFTSYQTKTQSLNLGSIHLDPSNKKSTLYPLPNIKLVHYITKRLHE